MSEVFKVRIKLKWGVPIIFWYNIDNQRNARENDRNRISRRYIQVLGFADDFKF